MRPLTIDPSISSLLRVGAIHAQPVRVGPAEAALQEEIGSTCSRLSTQHAGSAPADIAGLSPARELYRAFSIDPTHTRPSSEALLRRILQGKPFPSILNAVDVCNLCAVRYLLPIGLYDAGKIRGPGVLRRGLPGESYAGIRKDDVNLASRPTLADDDGPFGNPTSDSLRTSVTRETVSLWMVIFAPASMSAADLRRNVDDASQTMARHLAPSGSTVATESYLSP